MSRLTRKYPEEYSFLPLTYCFKHDYDDFIANKHKEPYWIIKPVDAARGEGIRVISSQEKIEYDKDLLASEYIKNPHLIKGHKYDLRVYVLVTCADPLRIFVFKEGLVRFASNPYELSKKSVKNNFSHLTNFSINKDNEDYR